MNKNIPLPDNNYVSVLLPIGNNRQTIKVFLNGNMTNIGDLKKYFIYKNLYFNFKYDNKILSDTLPLNQFIKDYSKNRNSNTFILIAVRDSSSSSSSASSASNSNRYASSSVNSRRHIKLSLDDAKKIIKNEYQGNHFKGIEALLSSNMINANLSAHLYQYYLDPSVNLGSSSSYSASSAINRKISYKSAAGNVRNNNKERMNYLNTKIKSINKNTEKIKLIRKVIDLYTDYDKVYNFIIKLIQKKYITNSQASELLQRYLVKKALNNKVNSILKNKKINHKSLIYSAIELSNLNKNTKDHYKKKYNLSLSK